MEVFKSDVVIVGAGGAGLRAAIAGAGLAAAAIVCISLVVAAMKVAA